MELTCKEPPWVTIDPDLIISGELELADLERYWTSPMGAPGKKEPCCNCERTLPIRESGLCQDCYEVAKGKRGSGLLNALTVFRAKVAKIQMVPINRVGGFDETFSRPKVVGQVKLPATAPVSTSPKITIPDQTQQEADEDETEDEGIRVVDEDGTDLGTLTAFSARMAASESMAVAVDHEPVSILQSTPEPHKPIVPKVSRALIVEVGESEIEFRVRQGGMDIKVDDGTGCIWMVQGIGPEILMDLYSMAKHAMEASNV